MNEERREEVYKLVAAVKKATDAAQPSQEVIDEQAEALGVESVGKGKYEDYAYQYEMDEKFAPLMDGMLGQLSKLRYMPEFAEQETRKKIHEENEKIYVEIVKLLEYYAIPQFMVTSMMDEMERMIAQPIGSAKNTANNRASQVVADLAQKQFGEEFNMSHVQQYLEKHSSEKE